MHFVLHKNNRPLQVESEKPTLSFDERGHQKNHITYFAAANGANGELPAVIYPTVERFLGEGGTFLNPEAAHHTVEGVAPGTEIHGKEAVGGMEFAPVVLAPGQSVQYVVRFGMTGNETTQTGTMHWTWLQTKAKAWPLPAPMPEICGKSQ